jgi:hypothetical protein
MQFRFDIRLRPAMKREEKKTYLEFVVLSFQERHEIKQLLYRK